jgi:PAS domain S-box-containing protein
MTDDLPSRLQALEHKLRVLSEENDHLAERAEDSLLLGLISENIQNLQDKFEIFSSGLEQISILKGIPFCSCGQLIGSAIEKIESYASFSDSIDIGYPIKISGEVLTDLKNGPLLITNLENINCTFDGSEFQPVTAALVPFSTQSIANGVFLFIDNTPNNGRFAPMLMLLNHAVDIIVSKYDNMFLLDALQAANKQLEQRVQDRTFELTRANKALQESELKYRQLVENANDSIFVVQDGKLVFFNDKTLKDLKYTREELENFPLLGLVHPDFQDLAKEYYTKRLSGDPDIPSTYTITALTKDKEELTVQVSAVMVEWSGKPAVLVLATDISELRRLEESYHQAQKMEAIGQLASGVAHDFNNMLGGIIGATEMLGLYLPDQAKAKRFHQMILEAATRAASLTKKLLSFSRSSQHNSTPVDVHDIIRETLVLLENSIDSQVEIQVNLKAVRSTVIGDPAQLQNMFLNLGINSSHAISDGGNLSISSDITELDDLYCNYSTFTIQPGSYLEVEVRDTGVGIAPEHMGKIFEPFFTTKEQGQGTGLGLASVYGTIQQHGGAITVHSKRGTGTTFHVFLPLADAKARAQRVTPILQRGSGRILVVDDEEVMRLTAKAILEDLGYEVTVAGNGQEGLQLYLQEKSDFDLVLLDMIMPVMDGRDCFEAMRKHNPDALVVLSSGFSKEEDIQEMKAHGLAGFVRKPYRSSTLSQVINGALQQGADNTPSHWSK